MAVLCKEYKEVVCLFSHYKWYMILDNKGWLQELCNSVVPNLRMSYKIKFLVYLLPLLLCVSLGKYHMVKTSKKKYLVKTNSITPRTARGRNTDFIRNENEPAWLDKCSFKSQGRVTQKDVPGCGGGLKMFCQGGCLRIMKI